ncbi:MAG: CHAT domain-containing protein [Bacteroidetes bacterium]|nr:CHAT domain-containing protein [Bacteroidota bacterium]
MRVGHCVFNVIVFLTCFSACNVATRPDLTDPGFKELLTVGKQLNADSKTDSAIIVFNKALTIAGPSDSVALVYLELGDLYRIKNSFQEAFGAVEKFDSVFTLSNTKDSLMYAEREHLVGKILSNRGSFAEAIKHFQRSIQIKENNSFKFSLSNAKSYNYLGITYYYMSDYNQAMEKYQKAQVICEELGINGKDLADTYQNIAIIHSINGLFDESIRYLELSRKIRESDPSLKADLGAFYFNFGFFLSSIGKTEESISVYKLAEEILKEFHEINSTNLTHLYINLGNAYYLKGDFEKAKVYYANTINQLEQKLELTHPNLITARNNLGFIYYRTGAYRQALQLFKESLKVVNNPVTRVFLLRNAAKSLEAIGEADSARIFFESALAESLLRLGDGHIETSSSYLSLGEFQFRKKEYNLAISNLVKSISILETNYPVNLTDIGNARTKHADVLTSLGMYKLANDEYLLALKDFQKAAQNNKKGFQKMDFRVKDALYGRASLQRKMYRMTNESQYLTESLSCYMDGINIVENTGSNITDESKMILNQNNRQRIAEAIDVCYNMYNLTNEDEYIKTAFTLSGKSKASVLLSSVKRQSAFEIGGVPPDITAKEVSVREDIAVVQKILFEESQKENQNLSRINYLETRHFNLLKRYDSLIEYIGNNYPEYYRLRYDNKVLGVEDIQSKMGDQEVLLDYSFLDSLQFLIAISKSACTMVKLNDIYNSQQELLDLFALLKPDFSTLNRKSFEDFTETSYGLYRHLLGPVEEMIRGKELIVVPDGLLGYLPFEVLLTRPWPGGTSLDYASLPYLLFQNPVSYTYSATIRFSDFGGNKYVNGKAIAFVPDYSETNRLRTVVADNEWDKKVSSLRPLPYALMESENVLNILKGKLLSGKQASKAEFIQRANNYEILHLAMHTQINDENPLYSRLIFNPDSDSIDHFSLSTYELYNLKLNANLVVLSACNTGWGNLQQGEGIMSLTRGFIYAGVPSIVMTTWEVHDQSGAELMSDFYTNLSEGRKKDDALKQAKIDFLQQSNKLQSHPYFWSTYVLIGDPAPLKLHLRQADMSLEQWLFLSVMMLILVVGVVLLVIKKRGY